MIDLSSWYNAKPKLTLLTRTKERKAEVKKILERQEESEK